MLLKGKVNSTTRIFLSDGKKSTGESEVSILHRRPIVKMHVLPSLESFKHSEIFTAGVAASSRRSTTTSSSSSSASGSSASGGEPAYNMDETFTSHIKPYLGEKDPVLIDTSSFGVDATTSTAATGSGDDDSTAMTRSGM